MSTRRPAASSRRSCSLISCGTSKLDRVQSINASGHKYGLVYPGVGWAIWRDQECLPRDLIFDVNYLGGSMPTFALNFSRPGSEVIAQYFMFLALGAEGYREIQCASSRVAQYIAREIAEIGPYRLLTDGSDLPVFAFTTAPGCHQLLGVRCVGLPARERSGWCRRTRSRKTARTCQSCGWWSGPP